MLWHEQARSCAGSSLQAMRVNVPPTGNETISMLMTTSWRSPSPWIRPSSPTPYAPLTYQIIPLLLVAAIWYIIITSDPHGGTALLIERHYGKGFDLTVLRLLGPGPVGSVSRPSPMHTIHQGRSLPEVTP